MRFVVNLLVLLSFVFPLPAQAITIDTFAVNQAAKSQVATGVIDYSLIGSVTSLGGTRAIAAQATGGGAPDLELEAKTSSGSFFHVQGPSVTGWSQIHWDGDADPTDVNPVGLGGIDLTEDAGDSFLLNKFSFDFADAKTTTIQLTVYDASDPSGQTYSLFTIPLIRSYTLEDIAIPFASFTSQGPNGPADMSNIGALSLYFDGSNPSYDFALDSFTTNGFCPLTPGVGGKVLDDCGECIPPSDPAYNQSCADCLGVPNGPTVPGTSCNTGELGPCAPGIYQSDCSCKRVSDPMVEICDGADNNCNGEIDEVYPQLGLACGVSTESCDIQGVYVCDSVGGIRCEADLGSANLSGCDVEIGCDGIPGSGLTPDDCGICGGDGSTCDTLGCDSVNISELLFELDGGAKEQEGLIRSVTKIIKRKSSRPKIKNFVTNVRAEAHELQIANWILSWTLPIVSVQCTSQLAAEFCVFNDNTPIVEKYRQGSEALRKLGLKAVRKLKRVTQNPTLTRRWRKRMNNRHNANVQLTDQVPQAQAVCSSPTTEP